MLKFGHMLSGNIYDICKLIINIYMLKLYILQLTSTELIISINNKNKNSFVVPTIN